MGKQRAPLQMTPATRSMSLDKQGKIHSPARLDLWSVFYFPARIQPPVTILK